MEHNLFRAIIFLCLIFSLPFNQLVYAQTEGSQASAAEASASQAAVSSGATNDTTSGHTHIEEPNNAVISFAMVLMFCLYFIQGYVALQVAKSHTIKINGSNKNIFDITFGDIEALTSTWIFSIGIVGAPFLLSFFSAMPRSHLIGSSSHLAIANTFHSALIALIMVLITVELTLISDLRGQGIKWRNMLILALSLDIVALFLFVGVVGSPTSWANTDSIWTYLFMTVTFIAALLSSFAIVLFSKVANQY